MGYVISDNLVSDLFILCEGPKDIQVLDELFFKMGLAEKYRIKMWPLGGDIMNQLDLSVFQESHKLMALIDADPKSDTVRKNFIKQCNEKAIPVHRLQRYAIENYFTLSAIEKATHGKIPEGLTKLDPKKGF
jgi:5S rRNA maturation endonuclease (ribonuclease M5)